uniref:TmcA/NAT10 N-terminal domain-containing protein n=1 Tax=Sphaeramia orbicularis TaxID=375764 RepID=A0A672ZXZ3_9TELE
LHVIRKKVDNRIRVQIENGVALQHRTLFVVVGDRGRDQVVILHHMLSKATVKARPSVLWCYKKDLGFSSNRKKRMRQLQKKIKTGTLNLNQDDPFELFVAATNIRYCYYNETHKILGNTYGMCVLQDFEALTPNLLARTIETVEGGGIVVILLRTMNSLKQLYTMTMDVHSRYRTEAHQDVVGRFNERFILSLASCKNCVVIDDQLSILPISSHMANIKPVPPKTQDGLSPREQELKDLKESLQEVQPVGVLVDSCRTMDQVDMFLVKVWY